MDKINWWWLSKNKNAIHILERNLDKLNKNGWSELSLNPNIMQLVKLDTVKMRDNCNMFASELAAYVFHPNRLVRLCETYDLELDEYFESV